MDTFDLTHTALEGVNLIEASAGTGKTYTITGLFLRLIIEKNVAVDNILVVTYTEAATAELKERIRCRLLDARDAFVGVKSNDLFINNLVEKYNDLPDAHYRIDDAIRCFDQASIFTIHGFCMRTLYENAFESGSLFDTELIENQLELETDTIYDFWRTRIYNSSFLFLHYLIKKKVTPETLLSSIGACIFSPQLKIIPDGQGFADIEKMENEYQAAFLTAFDEWHSSKSEVAHILLNSDSLNRNKYRRASVKNLIVEMDKLMSPMTAESQPLPGPPLFKGFYKFTSSAIGESIKKEHIAPGHLFFDMCETLWVRSVDLEKLYDGIVIELKKNAIGYVRTKTREKKQRENIRSFDDLLLDVHNALNGEKGRALAGAIRRKYNAALIDEFQDTDPVQYSIFKTVFGYDDSILFLIGDPKQAIYGFRGADIFTYMEAANNAKNIYTLKENYRSEPLFVTAVNTIFSNASLPFIYKNIGFETIHPPNPPVEQEELVISGEEKMPFVIWRMDNITDDSGNKVNSIPYTDRAIADGVASEILRLLGMSDKGNIRIGNRPFKSGDSAVLVRTNREADLVKESLNRLGIPGVVYGSGNVFESKEANEMEIVLSGIIRPDKDPALKAALATEMIGASSNDLLIIDESNDGIERHRDIFLNCRSIWYGQGFIKMFRVMLRKEHIMKRLIQFFDGERRITNILHLAEILQKKSVESRYDADDLLKWFQRQLNPYSTIQREEQLRLESDENAVKIVTIHKSKGLEFPVVFCPFLFGSSKLRKNNPVLFHDEMDGKILTLDLGSNRLEQSRADAEKELLAENMRLAYVALTRAKNRCYLVWGKLKYAETSALAYLLHQPANTHDDIARKAVKRYSSLDERGMSKDLHHLCGISSGTIFVSGLPKKSGRTYRTVSDGGAALSTRQFNGKIDKRWRVSSFSSIAHNLYPDDATNHDEALKNDSSTDGSHLDRQLKDDGDIDPVFLFPKGANAGTCLHEIFETIDFTKPDSDDTAAVVQDKLINYGFGAEWKDTISNMVRHVLSVPLRGDGNEFSLNSITEANRLHELEFYYPVHDMMPSDLGTLFSEVHSQFPFEGVSDRISALSPIKICGYMKGFIDLVFQHNGRFYIVDWKSNFLGYQRNDYRHAELSKEMINRFYFIQYHIYAVALHKYLSVRMPRYRYENDFGGIYYLFLRGISVDVNDSFGVFFDKPHKTFINRLCTYFEKP